MNDSSKTNKAAKLLAESVCNLMNSETYKAALQFRNKFHAYSFRNSFLIYTQCPAATYVAGYHAWLKLGRHVRKGESGISILAPMTRKAKDDEGNDKAYICGFKSTTVFDVNQTEGQDLPELPVPKLLELDSESIRQTITALEQYAKTQNITVIKTTFTDTALGSFHYRSKTIQLREDLPPLQELKTTIHELAHALMHEKDDNKPRHVKELEAESVAFLTCDALGLDSSSYSFAYLSTWADDPDEILPAAERACKVADEILGAINTLNLSPMELPMAA
jgi:antirestriction protein ArdC